MYIILRQIFYVYSFFSIMLCYVFENELDHIIWQKKKKTL